MEDHLMEDHFSLKTCSLERHVPVTQVHRERERENGNVMLTHSLSFSKVGHPPRIWSTTTDQFCSSNNCLYSSTFCTSKSRRGGGPGGTDREREEYPCATDLPCQDSVNVLCARATGTGRLGPHDLVSRLTKSPELSPQEIWEAGYLGRKGREEAGSQTAQVHYTCAGPHPSKDLCPEVAARGQSGPAVYADAALLPRLTVNVQLKRVKSKSKIIRLFCWS